jgi:SPP1 gp7 family putative phage head morphogenesis protein
MLITKKRKKLVFKASGANRSDPTKTIVLRTRFAREMRRRFRDLKQAIRKSIIELDGFNLKTNKIEPGTFKFSTDAGKHAGFMEWLNTAEHEGILQVRKGTPLASAASNSWMNTYIDTAYKRGVSGAASAIRAEGGTVSQRWVDAAFNRPIHADTIGLIYSRTYSELVGITDTMDQQISRVLAEGLSNGAGPMEIASDIIDRVEGIGEARAEMLARTETIAAHAEATLNSYEEAGIEGVDMEVEFSTSDDDAVCPECDGMAGDTVSVDEARGVIPVHPNCRCAWLPVINDGQNIELE